MDPNQIPLKDLPQAGGAPAQDSSPASTARLLQDEVVVENGGETFIFRIPTTRDEIRVGSQIPRLRRIADPESAGEGMDSLDPGTFFYLRAIALFLTCLKSTDAKWIYSPGLEGKPTIKWDEWPASVTNRVLEIALSAQDQVARFHSPGATDQ